MKSEKFLINVINLLEGLKMEISADALSLGGYEKEIFSLAKQGKKILNEETRKDSVKKCHSIQLGGRCSEVHGSVACESCKLNY